MLLGARVVDRDAVRVGLDGRDRRHSVGVHDHRHEGIDGAGGELLGRLGVIGHRRARGEVTPREHDRLVVGLDRRWVELLQRRVESHPS